MKVCSFITWGLLLLSLALLISCISAPYATPVLVTPTPAPPSGPPPPVPHTLIGRSNCLYCHAVPGGMPADHSGRGPDVCLDCHRPLMAATLPPQKPGGEEIKPPRIPHTLAGREGKCLTCHVIGGPGVGEPGGIGLPEDHKGRTPDMCLGCHQVKAAAGPAASPTPSPQPAMVTPPPPSVTPTPTPVAGPPLIPHTLEGREGKCLMCHVIGGPGVGEPGGIGLPEDHKGRTPDMCLGCHRTKE